MYLVYKDSFFWLQEAVDSVRGEKKIWNFYRILSNQENLLLFISMFSGPISVCCLHRFFLFCLLPTICLWLGLFDLICAWKTDESRRQQQGAVTESCSRGEWFLRPQEHSYPPRDGSALQQSHPHARILSKKVQWIAVSCHRPRCISFRLRENPLESVTVDDACCLFMEKQHKGPSRPSLSIPRKWWAKIPTWDCKTILSLSHPHAIFSCPFRR